MRHWCGLFIDLYGVLLIIGGLMGYAKAKSLPSLIAGAGFGIVFLVLGYFYHVWWYAPVAVLVLALVLAIIMGNRYRKTQKPMPAVPIVVLSVLVALLQVLILLE